MFRIKVCSSSSQELSFHTTHIQSKTLTNTANMAPALLVSEPQTNAEQEWQKDKLQSGDFKEAFQQGASTTDYEVELKGTGRFAPAKYPHYLPYWDATVKYPPLEPFEHTEHGLDADPSFSNLLSGGQFKDLTGNIGAEVTGVQLSKLSNAGKDELARFVAEKKVVAFRAQDFADLPIQEALDFAEYYGPSHIHPASGAPKGFPGVHLVHRSASDTTVYDFFQERTNSVTWHSDVSYEIQPPGTTFLYVLDGPLAGGDTLFANLAVSKLLLESQLTY
jgi:sulfonate dioxygenase